MSSRAVQPLATDAATIVALLLNEPSTARLQRSAGRLSVSALSILQIMRLFHRRGLDLAKCVQAMEMVQLCVVPFGEEVAREIAATYEPRIWDDQALLAQYATWHLAKKGRLKLVTVDAGAQAPPPGIDYELLKA